MSKKEVLGGRLSDTKVSLFEPTTKETEAAVAQEEKARYKSATFYIEGATLEAINILAFEENKGKSEVMREILNSGLDNEILKRGQERYEKLK